MVIINVSGDLDLMGAPVLCAAIEDTRNPVDPDHVIVDLSRVHFCDSKGLRALLDAAREVAIAGGHLVAIVPEAGQVRRLVTLTGALEFLSVTADRHQVVASLEQITA